MSENQTIDFGKISEEQRLQDLFDYQMNHKIEMCQDLSGLNFVNDEIPARKKFLEYQKCLQQSIRLDYDLTRERKNIQDFMNFNIFEKWSNLSLLKSFMKNIEIKNE